MSNDPGCSARQESFRGWEACHLQNEYVRLVGVPAIGGRVMAYDLGPYPFFFVDPDLAGKLFSAEENMGDGSMAAWKNYGGDKTWPAPQGWDNEQQWHGPPDPILDSGQYTLEACTADAEGAALQMTSPPDPRTGVQITRRFQLRPGSSRVAVHLSFRNIKEKPIRWSIWDVVQLRAEKRFVGGLTYDESCYVTAPLNPDSRFEQGFNVMFGAEDNPQWQVDSEHNLFRAQYQWKIGKVGLDSPAGWIAFSQAREGYAFVTRFPFEPDMPYPDDGATVECWTVGAGEVANLDYSDSQIYLMETEVLGPLREIGPGEAVSFELEWAACHCQGPIIAVEEGGCAAVPLQASKQGDYLRLQGSFGAFDSGELQLLWQGSEGQDLGRVSLGPVDPLNAILLDRFIPFQEGATEITLQIVTTAGAAGLLTQATIAGETV